jgi:Dna[CI] antecedent DciA-like protein
LERISGRSLAARLFGASPARTLALLEAAWPLAVGPELARRTEVLGIEGTTLRVRVPDAGWRKVLHRMQPQILGHLREIAGDLAPKRMGFVEGGILDSPPALSAPSNPPQSDAAPRSGGAARGGFQGGSRTPIAPGVSARSNQPQSTAAPHSGGDARGGFQGGSRAPIEPGASAPPEIKDPDIRQRFVETMARYLERSKGRDDA